MKKIISLSLLLSMAIMIGGPVLAGATTGGDVNTNLAKGIGGGTPPDVKVKWEMYRDGYDEHNKGEDEESKAGAQFKAPGEWDTYLEYTVCAIVTDVNGVADIDGVYADIFWPIDGPMHASMDPVEIDNPTTGCGKFKEQNTLSKLGKTEGYELFCDIIRDNNNDLPEFNDQYGPFSGLNEEERYDEICNPDGELMKETAYVYCDDKVLSWEDPYGDYRVEVIAQDTAGNSSSPLVNYYEYLPTTAFEVDFNDVSYGEVLLNVHKRISGDLIFDEGLNSDKPTVRNIGNTWLQMKVAQDDMKLGKSSGNWNVKYDGRVGNDESDWRDYNPFKFYGESVSPVYKGLYEFLQLSETEEMDFSILIKKWPNDGPFEGEMWLDAQKKSFIGCPG